MCLLLLIGLLGYNSVYHISSIITVIVQTAYYFVIFIISFKIATVLTQKSNITSITLRSIGDYSFGMYLIHPFVMYILVIAFLKIGNMDYNNWFFYLILFIATSIFSYIVTSIISRLPHSQFIIGIANKRKRGL
jgi:peptidoglycan/LPS O-acetylase OafA/YrhL